MVYLQKLLVLLEVNLDFLPATNWVDIIVVIFLIRGGYIGFNQGFSVELFKAAGAITACVLTLLYYSRLGEWLSSHSFLNPQIANFLSFLILILALLLIFRIVRILMFRIMHLELFGSLERWGGFTLGLARSIILASLFLLALTFLPSEYVKESVKEKSLSGPYLTQAAPCIFDFILRFRPEVEEN